MAFQEFYIQSGGSNLNAGSTTADAAAVTVTNASWDITAETYIGLTGIEFAAVNVGDWASIYLDAATVAVYIAQVTVVGALGVNITLSTTAKYGTKPAAGATGRSCKVAGAHASPSPWNSAGLGATTPPASTRVNIKQATYTRSANDTFSMPSTVVIPLWFRGYNTTLGDCDLDPTLAKPVLAYDATFSASMSGLRQIWSSINITANRSGSAIAITGAESWCIRMRVENTSANAAAVAWSCNNQGGLYIACWGKTPGTATTNGCWNVQQGGACVVGCVAEGQRFSIGAGTGRFLDCISLNSASDGFLTTTSTTVQVQNCTVYNATSDGIEFPVAPTVIGLIMGCAFWNCGGYGINNSSGTNTQLVFRSNNSFYACTSGNENGFGDSPSFFEKQETSQPYTSATDMTPVLAALARATAFPPGTFENATFRSYADIGAVQHQDDVPVARTLVVGPGSGLW